MAFSNDYFYLDSAKIRRRGLNPEEFERAVSETAMKHESIAARYIRNSLDQRSGPGASDDPYRAKVRNSFDPERSGQVAVAIKAFSLFSGSPAGTSHGTGYRYDTHVPLLFAGCGIRPGMHDEPCSPNDIAPTLCTMLGLAAPDKCAGHALRSARNP